VLRNCHCKSIPVVCYLLPVLLFYLLSWLIQGYTKKNLDYFLTNILRVQSSAILQELQEKRVIALILKGLVIPPQARINIFNKIITQCFCVNLEQRTWKELLRRNLIIPFSTNIVKVNKQGTWSMYVGCSEEEALRFSQRRPRSLLLAAFAPHTFLRNVGSLTPRPC
jgi:hypothetical protein